MLKQEFGFPKYPTCSTEDLMKLFENEKKIVSLLRNDISHKQIITEKTLKYFFAELDYNQ